jgi:hypothetical protein
MERTVEVYNKATREWKQSHMLELLVGDIFRMYEPDGTKVIDTIGHDVFKVVAMPYLKDDIPGVSVERYFL